MRIENILKSQHDQTERKRENNEKGREERLVGAIQFVKFFFVVDFDNVPLIWVNQ